MKFHRLVLALTVFNLGLLVFLLAQIEVRFLGFRFLLRSPEVNSAGSVLRAVRDRPIPARRTIRSIRPAWRAMPANAFGLRQKSLTGHILLRCFDAAASRHPPLDLDQTKLRPIVHGSLW